MNAETVIAALRSHRAELDAMGIGSLSIFGSVARGEAGAGSDVDLLVEFSRPIGLFDLIEAQARIETWLGRPVDLVPRDGIKRQLRDRILAEAILAA
jgi:predicted nucleotidyltransferase